jgi:selenocysteine lyase/cysteine desulfurase
MIPKSGDRLSAKIVLHQESRMTLDLRSHFRTFRDAAPQRIHLAAHSHHYWPDVACAAQQRVVADTARLVDDKWSLVFGELIPCVQRGIAGILSLPDPATIAVAPNTHDFIRRLLSALPAEGPARILTTDSEFHSFTRQVARLEEDGLVIAERIATEPFDSFPARFAAAARRERDLVFVSQVFFNSGGTAGDLAALVAAVPDDTLLAIDGYHGFMALPTDLSGIAHRAFYLAGGYKYAMAGEGACFLHCPPGYAPRPRDTGWLAAFGALTGAQQGVPYGIDGTRFLGATFDPSGLYRLAAVLDWIDDIGLTVPAIHAHVLALQEIFLGEMAAVGPLRQARLVTPVSTGTPRGHFLTFETPQAGALHDRLAAAAIVTDVRGDRIRFGFGCYHAPEEIAPAVAAIARALA